MYELQGLVHNKLLYNNFRTRIPVFSLKNIPRKPHVLIFNGFKLARNRISTERNSKFTIMHGRITEAFYEILIPYL